MPAAITIALIIVGLGTPATVSAAASIPVLEPQATAPSATAEQEGSLVPHQARPNPDASGQYHVGDGVLGPRLIYSVDPEFTEKARRKKLGGTCLVSILVDTEGNPQDVRVVKSIASTAAPSLRDTAAGLDEKAVEAAKQYKFKPATFQGKPVPVEVKVEIGFRIY